MPRVRLIHWNAAEAAERARQLRTAGYQVAHKGLEPHAILRELAGKPPAAVVIDLTRMPSQGRDLALFLRQRKTTRHVPLVFAGGDPEKVKRIRKLLPDATYTGWNRIGAALKRALARPPAKPVVPDSSLAGYSGTPLPKKLGIKENSVVALLGAPPGFGNTLGKLPAGVRLRTNTRDACDRILWFTKSRKQLEKRVGPLGRALSDKGGLWIAWPKQASGVATDLTQNDVRRIGLAAGLVDYKICAIDATWSGLLFAVRKSK